MRYHAAGVYVDGPAKDAQDVRMGVRESSVIEMLLHSFIYL